MQERKGLEGVELMPSLSFFPGKVRLLQDKRPHLCPIRTSYNIFNPILSPD
jgi:hypothetical protein